MSLADRRMTRRTVAAILAYRSPRLVPCPLRPAGRKPHAATSELGWDCVCPPERGSARTRLLAVVASLAIVGAGVLGLVAHGHTAAPASKVTSVTPSGEPCFLQVDAAGAPLLEPDGTQFCLTSRDLAGLRALNREISRH